MSSIFEPSEWNFLENDIHMILDKYKESGEDTVILTELINSANLIMQKIKIQYIDCHCYSLL